jgi:hypothetical protein
MQHWYLFIWCAVDWSGSGILFAWTKVQNQRKIKDGSNDVSDNLKHKF